MDQQLTFSLNERKQIHLRKDSRNQNEMYHNIIIIKVLAMNRTLQFNSFLKRETQERKRFNFRSKI